MQQLTHCFKRIGSCYYVIFVLNADDYWINELGAYGKDGKVFWELKRIHWHMFFSKRTKSLFQNYGAI